MEERKWNQTLSGSYTVEAAFVMPVLLGIAFVIIYVLFLLHDQVILQGNLSYVLCAAAEETIDQADYPEILSKGLWYFEIQDMDIDKEIGRVSGKVTCRANLKIPVMQMFLNRMQYISCAGEYYSIQPEQMLFDSPAKK